ncbi:MAG: hypothetical protein Q8R24_07465 [Legionellaceae bacterium]|nr:hypothetical protein [Legionellaceae bacterium]
MPTSSGTTVGTSQAPLLTLPRSPRIAMVNESMVLNSYFSGRIRANITKGAYPKFSNFAIDTEFTDSSQPKCEIIV